MPKSSTSWKPGQSGNPSGKNGRERMSQLRMMLEPHAENLVMKAKNMALEGDVMALRLCLDRLMPPIRIKDEPIVVKDLGKAKTLVQQGQAIINAISSGEITPSEGATVMTAVANQARIIEVDELERRLAAIEAANEI